MLYSNGNGGVLGVGSVNAVASLPLVPRFTVTRLTQVGRLRFGGTNTVQVNALISAGSANFSIEYPSSVTAMTTIQNADFTNADRSYEIKFTYKAF